MVLVCFLIYRIGRPRFIVNKELESDKLENNLTNKFSFFDKYFEVENPNGKFNYKYSMIYRAFDKEDCFYLYITKENAFLLSKNTFSLGNANDFSSFIKSKCHSKYKMSK